MVKWISFEGCTSDNREVSLYYRDEFFGGGLEDPPTGLNSFNFMQFLGKLGKIVCWRIAPWRVGVLTSSKS